MQVVAICHGPHTWGICFKPVGTGGWIKYHQIPIYVHKIIGDNCGRPYSRTTVSLTGMHTEILLILSPTFKNFFVSPFKRRNVKK